MSSNTILKLVIFEKNIAVKTVPKLTDFLSEILLSPKIPEFHFILAFAIEERKRNGKGKGKFSPSWNVKDFSAEKIIKLKSEYENVKVVISIGGGGANYPFNPEDKQKWIDNAKKSLEKIIEPDYKSSTTKIVIDGIDITYERIESDDFVECMAEVMKYFKMKGLKVSIALSSFPTDPLDRVFSIHNKLYEGNKDLIDWVDYNLYSQTMSTTHYSLSQSDSFCVRTILAGFSTDPNNTGNIPLDVFLKNCRKHKIQLLPIKKSVVVPLASSSNFRTPQVPISKPKTQLTLASKPENQPPNPLNSRSPGHLAKTPKLQSTSSFIPQNQETPSNPQVPASKPKTQSTLSSKPKNQSTNPLNSRSPDHLAKMPKLRSTSSFFPKNQQTPSKPQVPASKPKTQLTLASKPGNQPTNPLNSRSPGHLAKTPKLQSTSSFIPKNQQTPPKPQVLASKPKTQSTLTSNPGNQLTNPLNSGSHGQPSQTLKRKPTSSFMPKNQQTASSKPKNQSMQPRQSTSVYKPERQLTPSFMHPNRSTLTSNSRYNGQSQSASNSRILSSTPASELGVRRARASKPGIGQTHPSNHIIPLAPKLGIKQTHAPKSRI